ncbi:MAG TPA: response regulator [Gemmatimonadales bacterium]|jgi:DNA-binding NtrC family response regulator
MDSGKLMAATVVHADDGLEYVLVVDDEPVVRRFAARALVESGFGVHEAGDGAMALELIRSGGIQASVVVCDIVMPRMNGVQLLESLAVLRPGLPIILMSGYGAAELAKRGIASPCAVLAKPFPAELLVAEVRRCIRVR